MDAKNGGACSFKNGALPSCAPLSAGYVPYQRTDAPKYENEEALTRGTLFPGLDLPFMNTANKSNPYAGTPIGELMAIDFAVKELNLYLDTHREDTEAFEMLQSLLRLKKTGRAEYVRRYGPIDLSDLEDSAEYNWLCDPWPWEYRERRDD